MFRIFRFNSKSAGFSFFNPSNFLISASTVCSLALISSISFWRPKRVQAGQAARNTNHTPLLLTILQPARTRTSTLSFCLYAFKGYFQHRIQLIYRTYSNKRPTWNKHSPWRPQKLLSPPPEKKNRKYLLWNKSTLLSSLFCWWQINILKMCS